MKRCTCDTRAWLMPALATSFAFAIAAPLGGGAGTASAADADHYKGRTLTIMVASKAGGGTDTTARMVGRYWGKYIPGNPKILIRNKSLQVVAGNEFHHNTRPDGLSVGVFAGAGTLGPVARKSKAVRYDPLQWGIVGMVDRGPTIVFVRKSALPRLTNPKAKPVAVGSVSTDRPQDSIAVYGGEYLGWNIKFVLGYPDSNHMYLAYERGEIDMFGSGTRKILKRFIKDGDAVGIAAEVRRADYPEVPSFVEVLGGKKPSGMRWDAFRAWSRSVDKWFATPPKTPADNVRILRASFMAMAGDSGFKAEAERVLGGGYVVINGADTAEMVAASITIPDEVKGEMKRLRAKYGLPQLQDKKKK